jgi:hypothetical protein
VTSMDYEPTTRLLHLKFIMPMGGFRKYKTFGRSVHGSVIVAVFRPLGDRPRSPFSIERQKSRFNLDQRTVKPQSGGRVEPGAVSAPGRCTQNIPKAPSGRPNGEIHAGTDVDASDYCSGAFTRPAAPMGLEGRF